MNDFHLLSVPMGRTLATTVLEWRGRCINLCQPSYSSSIQLPRLFKRGGKGDGEFRKDPVWWLLIPRVRQTPGGFLFCRDQSHVAAGRQNPTARNTESPYFASFPSSVSAVVGAAAGTASSRTMSAGSIGFASGRKTGMMKDPSPTRPETVCTSSRQ